MLVEQIQCTWELNIRMIRALHKAKQILCHVSFKQYHNHNKTTDCNICNIKYFIPSLKNSVVVSWLIKLRNSQRPDLTVRVSLGKHGLALTHITGIQCIGSPFANYFWDALMIWTSPWKGLSKHKLIFYHVYRSLIFILNYFFFFNSS